MTLDDTHRPDLRSWVESANDPSTDFPIQNLPFGVFRRAGSADVPRVGVAIGDQILDVEACHASGLLPASVAPPAMRCAEPALNGLMDLGTAASRELRRALSELLRADAPAATQKGVMSVLTPMQRAEMLLPARIGDYTDFYASINHARNIGSMLRPDNPLLPNYKWVPIGYHGRSSSIVPSGSAVRRPMGQTREANAEIPSFGASKRMDYELEVGALIATGNSLGTNISLDEAEDHVLGLCLVNDWSARDIQAWEYQPLGPFLAKSFATSVSPWIVTLDALEPFRVPAYRRPPDDPAPLPYLFSHRNESGGGFDITLEVLLVSEQMRARKIEPMGVSRGSFADMYWTFAQLVAHHTSNGCNLRSGDLLASGTVSGATKESRGSLTERTWRGSEPLALPTGETRAFLEDGDEVILRGYCERPGLRRIGFGECRGRVQPANE